MLLFGVYWLNKKSFSVKFQQSNIFTNIRTGNVFKKFLTCQQRKRGRENKVSLLPIF